MPHVSAEAMSLHLAEIASQVASNAHAVVVLDGAGWHQTGGRLCVPDNITLLPLPPYAPELNPIENLGQYLRSNLLSFRIWDTYEAIRDACCAAWNTLIADQNRLASITTRDWAPVSL